MSPSKETTTTTETTITQITATTHFPIKLTVTNFPVWRKQIQATLIGLDLFKFLDGTHQAPVETLPENKPNPQYQLWFRQDQTLISALLGSCTETIQPIVSSANSSHQAWKQLSASYASASRSRVISLKTKLSNNPRGTRSITEFLLDMRSIADDLALAQSPIDDEDLLVHILS
ncbi:hypothetical protein QVD17_40062 [Tagetes erecta]|uniref:Retrotransposon Copia-like N-terminal domain-containing protein n=1 Tax=Tagetes erecta TaxID=13708 RepID=A0AAD8JRJ9_TARER|nr:hypothetical protein QVD17_40062 [Tagetes erecta]